MRFFAIAQNDNLVNSLFIEMNMPRQSFWTVGACVIMFTRNSVRLPAEGVPHLASYFALMSTAVATGVEGSSKAAALL